MISNANLVDSSQKSVIMQFSISPLAKWTTFSEKTARLAKEKSWQPVPLWSATPSPFISKSVKYAQISTIVDSTVVDNSVNNKH